ncbi:beta-phosphoglucomutase [Aureibaculum sp. 2210JD6-5]|uniref:beta-phosphoglucomutase n=1 Tax=Aureibaculum sp. 2210JD6-5 TaxID=3103957 RepID=UPI002AADECFE|nr:beta-phosphoglucomutase [Aureibaculum sp. 2210JD6-5]MDY7394459.1 beta-phosphoglucomutase [Aureibaculum sp. 2210JD6-5]
MNKKAIIFDLDGVIVDTAKYHYLAWKNLANELGFDFTETQNELLKGVSRVKSLEILLEIGKVNLSQDKKDKLLIEKNKEYLEEVNQMTDDEVLPGILELLNFLDKSNIKYALGSASKNAPLILKKVGLYNRFAAIVDGNDVIKAKPDPEVFLIAAKKLNADPKDCIVFEDAIAGVQAANAAGMISIGIGEKETLHEADYIYADTSKINIDFITKLLGVEKSQKTKV